MLKPYELKDRFRTATFDRELAIRRNDADFLALGHPFIDAMLGYVGSYDFGGLAAARRVESKELRGRQGHLFIFIVRQRITREDGDECLFHFHPVFVSSDGSIDDHAARVAVDAPAAESSAPPSHDCDPQIAFDAAKASLEKSLELWAWEDDVEFVAMSWVQFT